ncbi:relaxase/mobilization nuclease domain-containing protein [Burkholderia cenocepacia]|uniref:relaxase/mobilization nuclease domain-containing protein n=1 Tax=Burkholderia cenocepacia TaxID=95486 RepID=UPI001B8F3704|nr:relaxase/mobilization nuclease domain-containing protein [Burkholderia cenocepacia]MBR7905819.1 relaxase/mobilization nuclease domain-containing protein [Burkholderia cenocepacia]MBR8426609.1 relaxase/mobilization nuclease domain-containing protein [Burkholderia cenocepacia]
MLVSNFESGSTRGAVDYVLSDKNHKGETRTHKPIVIKGDEFLTRQAGELSSKFSNETTSGVIAFAKGENPTHEEMLKIIERYEQTFLGNMKDRVAPLYVLHEEKNGAHIHVIIPNIDLATGKAYNPFPPGQMTKDLIKSFSSLENHNHNWEQVKEDTLKSKKSKPQQKSNSHKNDSDFFRALFKHSTDKRTFEKSCLDLVKSGEVKNRDELISFLKDNGYTFSRIGKDYLSIENPSGKNFRLKDGIFSDGSDYKERVKEATEQVKTFDPQKVADQINRLVAHRNAYNEKRYQANEPQATAYVAKPLAPKTQQSASQAPRVAGSQLPPPLPSLERPGATSPAQTSAPAQPKDEQPSGSGSNDFAPSGASSGLVAIGSANAQLSSAIAQLNSARTPAERVSAQQAVIRAKASLAKAQSQYEEEQKRIPTNFKVKI